MTDIRVPLTGLQAEWLGDLAQSGSESWAEAMENGARIEGLVLVIPPAAVSAAGLAVGMRADIASEGEYDIGLRSTVLGLSSKLASAGVTGAEPLTEGGVFGPGGRP